MLSLSWLLIAVPLASAFVLLLAGRRANAWGHWMGVVASGGAFVIALIAFFEMLGQPGGERATNVHMFNWIPGGELNLDAGLLVDPLSITFALLITFVGTLIHVYSVAYMETDPDRRRFFAYLNLFVAAMLLLVLADSFLLLFVGWEGVGLASYLLIGFWNHRTEYAVAAKKAFIANRVGDLGLLIAMMALFASVGALDFTSVFASVGSMEPATVTI